MPAAATHDSRKQTQHHNHRAWCIFLPQYLCYLQPQLRRPRFVHTDTKRQVVSSQFSGISYVRPCQVERTPVLLCACFRSSSLSNRHCCYNVTNTSLDLCKPRIVWARSFLPFADFFPTTTTTKGMHNWAIAEVILGMFWL
jgi:hypothetical protein